MHTCSHNTKLGQISWAVVVLVVKLLLLAKKLTVDYFDGMWCYMYKHAVLLSLFLSDHALMPSVLWHCWLGDRKGIWSVKSHNSVPGSPWQRGVPSQNTSVLWRCWLGRLAHKSLLLMTGLTWNNLTWSNSRKMSWLNKKWVCVCYREHAIEYIKCYISSNFIMH